MTTDEEKMYLSDKSYNVDSKKHCSDADRPQKGKNIHIDAVDKDYYVVDTEDNQHTGFQAMAVAPIVDGKPDMTSIYIACAGTNSGDKNDLITDAYNIPQARYGSAAVQTGGFLMGMVAGSKYGSEYGAKYGKKVAGSFGETVGAVGGGLFGGQVGTVAGGVTQATAILGDQHYQKVNAYRNAHYGNPFDQGVDFTERVAKNNGGLSNIKGVVGHSLGGAEAAKIGAKLHLPVTTFSSADASLHYTEADRQFLKEHPEMQVNFYHNHNDWVAKHKDGNDFGTNIVANVASDNKDGNVAIGNHLLGTFTFDKNGRLQLVKCHEYGPAVQGIKDYHSAQLNLDLRHFDQCANRWSKCGGPMSDSRKQLLEQVTANAIISSLANATREMKQALDARHSRFQDDQRELWRRNLAAVTTPYTSLTDAEATDAVHRGNCYYKDQVTGVIQKYEDKHYKMSDLVKKFNTLLDEIGRAIVNTVGSDQNLAKDIAELGLAK